MEIFNQIPVSSFGTFVIASLIAIIFGFMFGIVYEE